MNKLRIGARASALSQKQADLFMAALHQKYPELVMEKVNIVTKGDRILDRPLSAIGGKGVFVTKLEDALKDHRIDCAIHSAKDLPAASADCFQFFCLKRGSAKDVILLKKNTKEFKVVGTSSPRRENMLKRIYPDLTYKLLRGNIDTRIGKLLDGGYDAIILAKAGLVRLKPDLSACRMIEMNPQTFVPASCQGILCAEVLKDSWAATLLSGINDEQTSASFRIERKMMALMQADCHDATAAYSYLEKGERFVVAFYHHSPVRKITYHDDKNLETLAKELIQYE